MKNSVDPDQLVSLEGSQLIWIHTVFKRGSRYMQRVLNRMNMVCVKSPDIDTKKNVACLTTQLVDNLQAST